MNRNKDTLKDLFNRLTLQEQNNVINFAYLYDDVRSLRHQLQQKENIIKEVREYIEKYEVINGYYDSNYDGENDTYSHDTVKEDILEILDKGE